MGIPRQKKLQLLFSQYLYSVRKLHSRGGRRPESFGNVVETTLVISRTTAAAREQRSPAQAKPRSPSG